MLGLSRQKDFYLSEKDTAVGPLYLIALYQTDIISEPTFSFFVAEDGRSSHVDFGAPKVENVRSPD